MTTGHTPAIMELPRPHVRTIGNGSIVEVTFAAVSPKPRIVQVAAACDHQFTVTHATAQRATTLREHRDAWVQHTRDVGHDTGTGVLWLMTAHASHPSVSVREIMLVLGCVAQPSCGIVCASGRARQRRQPARLCRRTARRQKVHRRARPNPSAHQSPFSSRRRSGR